MEIDLHSFLVGLGLVVALLGLFNLWRALSRRAWPETIGKIQKSQIHQITNYPNFWFNSGLFSYKTARPIEDEVTSDRLRLSYIYVVGEFKYIGSQLFSAPITAPKNHIAGLSEGTKVKVFYKPSNPHVAFLAHSFAWPSVLVILAGVAVAMLGAYLKFYA